MNIHNYNYYFVCSKQNHKYLYTESFLKNIQKLKECNYRELLGQQMVENLMKIAKLLNKPIKKMVLNANGIFEEEK